MLYLSSIPRFSLHLRISRFPMPWKAISYSQLTETLTRPFHTIIAPSEHRIPGKPTPERIKRQIKLAKLIQIHVLLSIRARTGGLHPSFWLPWWISSLHPPLGTPQLPSWEADSPLFKVSMCGVPGGCSTKIKSSMAVRCGGGGHTSLLLPSVQPQPGSLNLFLLTWSSAAIEKSSLTNCR